MSLTRTPLLLEMERGLRKLERGLSAGDESQREPLARVHQRKGDSETAMRVMFGHQLKNYSQLRGRGRHGLMRDIHHFLTGEHRMPRKKGESIRAWARRSTRHRGIVLSRHLHRDYFPEGSEGDKTHRDALAKLFRHEPRSRREGTHYHHPQHIDDDHEEVYHHRLNPGVPVWSRGRPISDEEREQHADDRHALAQAFKRHGYKHHIDHNATVGTYAHGRLWGTGIVIPSRKSASASGSSRG